MSLVVVLVVGTICTALCAQLVASADAANPSLSDAPLAFSEALDAASKFVLSWTVADGELVAEVAVKSTGWVGVGFSPNGGMAGADIVMGWVEDDGTAVFSDRHAKASGLPQVDADQSTYELIKLVTEGDTTTMRFRRALHTCDDDDMVIDGTMRVIFAYGDDKPANGVPRKHDADKRSAKSVIFEVGTNEAQWSVTDADIEFFDVRFDAAATPAGKRTRYWWRGGSCAAYNITEKIHVVAYEMLNEGEETVTHHMIMNVCANALNATALEWVGSRHSPRAVELGLASCTTQPLIAWAVGGKGLKYPPEFGLPLCGTRETSTFMLDLHLDVVSLAEHTTRAGFRVYYTRKLRPNDGAFVVVGAATTPMLITPPRKEVTRVAHCPSRCTKAGYPAGGLTAWAAMPHMHTIGTKFVGRHILENGTELEPLVMDLTYDFDLQETRPFATKRRLMPGDQFRVECTTNAASRDTYTIGGEGTNDEMCLMYMLVYPPPDLTACLSTTGQTFVGNLLLNGAFGAPLTVAADAQAFMRASGAAERLTAVRSLLDKVPDWDKFEDVFDAQQKAAEEQAMVLSLCLQPGGDEQTELDGLAADVSFVAPLEEDKLVTATQPWSPPDACAEPTTDTTTTTPPPAVSGATSAAPSPLATAAVLVAMLRLF